MNSQKLSDDEKRIEKEMDDLQPVSGEIKQKIDEIINQAKKNKSISLRISDSDLQKLKEKAEKEGVPYQTLVTSILHKYVTNQLLDKDQVKRSFEIIHKG